MSVAKNQSYYFFYFPRSFICHYLLHWEIGAEEVWPLNCKYQLCFCLYLLLMDFPPLLGEMVIDWASVLWDWFDILIGTLWDWSCILSYMWITKKPSYYICCFYACLFEIRWAYTFEWLLDINSNSKTMFAAILFTLALALSAHRNLTIMLLFIILL